MACYENPEFYNKYKRATEIVANDHFVEFSYSFANIIANAVTAIFLVIYVVSIDYRLLLILLFAIVVVIASAIKGKVEVGRDKEMTPHKRSKDYVKRTVFLKDFAKDMRTSDIFEVMHNRFKTAVDENRAILKKYGVRMMILELLGGAGDSVAAKYLEILMQYLSRESQRLLTGGNCSTADKHARRMREVSEYIKMSPAAASLSEISARLYLCPPYLSKLIKEYFGKSFKELVVDERMNRAHRLIAKTDMNIGDAIRSVGYDNESYFHKEFKKRYGESPLSVRKKLRENAKMKI
jgi:AraC-like DNA-binding protein